MKIRLLSFLAIASAAFFIACGPVAAQWQVPDHSVPVGRGSGTGFKFTAPGTAGLPMISNGATIDPSFAAPPYLSLAGVTPTFVPGPTTPTTQGPLAADWLWGTSAARTDLINEGHLWLGKTWLGFGVAKDFTAAESSATGYPPVSIAPNSTAFFYATNSGSNNDVAAVIGDSNAKASNTTVFAGNLIARSEAGLSNVKLVGLEIDVQPGSFPVNAGSIGLAMNAFGTAVPAGIQFGGDGFGGSWDNGIVLNSINFAAIAAQAGSTIGWLVHTGFNVNYTRGSAIFVSNTHKLAFGDPGNATQASLQNDSGGNMRFVMGATGGVLLRNNADTNNLYSFTNSGTAEFGSNGFAQGAVALSGITSGAVSIKPQAAAGTYNFNLPTTAGTSGQVLTSAAGGTAPMTWTTLAFLPLAGGTMTGVASMSAGSSTTPSLNFGDAGTGFYRQGLNAVGVSSNGTPIWTFFNTGALLPNIDNAFAIGASSNRASAVYATTFFGGAGVTGVTCSGAPTASFASTGGIVTHC